jgi:hypothetical protein
MVIVASYLIKVLYLGRSRSPYIFTGSDSDSTQNSFQLRLYDSDSDSTALLSGELNLEQSMALS